jgi:UDP-glucose 4-epimerase
VSQNRLLPYPQSADTLPEADMTNVHLITGVAGFIGRCLAERLLRTGAFVAGFDNLSRGTLDNLAAFQNSPRFFFQKTELTDVASFSAAMDLALEWAPPGDIDVWHMAANSDILAGVRDPCVDLRDTFLTTFHTLQLMRNRKLARVAFASTSAVYGSLNGALHEDAGPLFPISSYGAMKLASEASVSAAVEAFLERAWIFRFPNVVGPFATHGVIYDFLNKLRQTPGELEVLGNGEQCKPYLLVNELVDAMLFIHERANDRLNYFNIGPLDKGMTVRAIAEEVVRAASPGVAIRYTGGAKGWVGDVPKFNYSVAKLRELGWLPQCSSEQAIRAAIAALVIERERKESFRNEPVCRP